MGKITKPCKREEEKYIFTEGIDYFKTGKTSIWGKGDKDTLKILEEIEIHGKWLHLTAGDGRYNLNLLKKVDFVVASDIDESALSKLWYNTPNKYKTKLKTEVFDITKVFPFDNNSFDGILCTGTLHLFPKQIFKKIFSEMDRTLKPKGKILIDFVTDAKRTRLDNAKPYIIGTRANYTHNEAKTFLKDVFKNYRLKMHESEVVEDIKTANPPYTLNCKFIILIADKK